MARALNSLFRLLSNIVGALLSAVSRRVRSRQIKAGRCLVGWQQFQLAVAAGVGIATIRRLRNAVASAAILVRTSYLDDVHVFAALEAGAAGYLLKDVQPDELVRAIRQTHQGESALHPKVAARLVQHTAQPASFADFTPRERDVLRLLAEGFPNKEIAGRLSLSEKTVKTHVSNILQKLGVSDRTQAALLAVRRGLVG